MLRVRRKHTAPETDADITQPKIHYVNGRYRRNENGHVPPVENNDVSVMDGVDQTVTNGLRSTSDVLYRIRDLLESSDLTPSSSSAAEAAEQNMSSVERLLASINDQLATKLRSDAQLRHETDKNKQMISEWMIVAAVIDRFCFIVFGICFLIGTTVLFLLATFVKH